MITTVKQSTNILYFDTLRALATFAVIVIHVTSPVVNMAWNKNMEHWWIGNVVDSAVRFAVPLFLMLSGATMLGKEYKLRDFYAKRFSRVLLPFLFWLPVYWLFRWLPLKPGIQPTEFDAIWQWTVNLFVKEGISKHFWYIYMILVIYLFVPFLAKVLQKLRMIHILYSLLGWVALSYALKSVPVNFYSWSGNAGHMFLGYFLYTGYLVLGYYLSKVDISWGKARFLSAVVFLITVFVSAFIAYNMSIETGRLNLKIYAYLSVNTIIQSVAVFVLLKNIEVKNKIILWIQRTISDYSYGIYLVHIIVLGIFFHSGIFWTMAYPLVSLPVVAVLTLCASFAIIFVLRKIPFGKYVAG